jgi:hypothetical protein
MKKIIIPLAIMLLTIGVTEAQTPDPNDPGIGGPGSSSVGAPSSDGVPVVPFDGGMSIMLAVSGISYAAKQFKAKRIGLI